MEPPVGVAPNWIILLTTYNSLVVLFHRPFMSANSETRMNAISADSWERWTIAAQNITSFVLASTSWPCPTQAWPTQRASSGS